MTSYEALEHLLNLCDYHNNGELVEECGETIKKDLDRLEKCEKAIEIIKWAVLTAEKNYDDCYILGSLTLQDKMFEFLKEVCKGK